MAKRITNERVKKWAKIAGYTGIPLTALLFWFMLSLGSIEITGLNYDEFCVGTYDEPCYAYINITVNEDIFIYPSDNWTLTAFPSDPQFKEVILYRSWGKGWRKIPLNKTCTGTWCGGTGTYDAKYSYAFRENKSYQLRLALIKMDSSQDVNWGIEL